MPKIEVDDEVFAWLQERATPFVDSPNSVLRRELLSSESVAQQPAGDAPNSKSIVRQRRAGELSTLISRGRLQVGDALVFSKRNGESYRGIVTASGEIQVHGRPYGSPSGALKSQLGYEINGWKNWVHESSGKVLDSLRS
ncbi:hypothetical protein ACHIPZ_29275 [Antrihabitans sp. NCIMB 15449]|uniref:RAMA domain-containing protein n=1 Tax=Antrihabitans spumae TaxID=3373370 RepID=A0ABW7JZF3_9NOCA